MLLSGRCIEPVPSLKLGGHRDVAGGDVHLDLDLSVVKESILQAFEARSVHEGEGVQVQNGGYAEVGPGPSVWTELSNAMKLHF